MSSEHELTAPVPLLLPNGRANPAATGWTRHQQHDTSGIGRGLYGWGRNKRWEYWGVVTPTHCFALTIGALDYANVRQVWVLDRATEEEIDTFEISPLSRGVSMPGSSGEGPSRSRGRRVSLEFTESAAGTRLRGTAPRVSVDVLAETRPGHEQMGTAAPFSPFLADYTVKDPDRPIVGTLTVDGVTHRIEPDTAWGVLDHARARAAYRTDWNWGAGGGFSDDGRRIGLQLGGGGERAVRDGISPNGFTVDGRVQKVANVLEWEFDPTDFLAPWRIHNDRMDLTFTPYFDRAASTNLLIVRSRTHQCFGTYAGRLRTDDGEWITVSALDGWAEDVHNRW
ncbi:DUF2804 domain-containing protein [Microbacterium gorillae]|uniref:DUF2804 domain-containing protein n=1 Tax=Microbacterium gorillae TaxID=1231063 RepID=UPI0005900A1E|nr:DUF2804 domain-containing protein [Microbacterium gorillae]